MEFPIEIWQLILNHFDLESLKKCLIWSENFRELIVKTPSLMRKLPVIIPQDCQRVIPFVVNYGDNVKSVKFIDCKARSTLKFNTFLEKMPNVEEIICENPICGLNSHKNIGDQMLENNEKLLLLRLTKLEIKNEAKSLNHLIQIFKNSSSLQLISINVNLLRPLTFLGDFIMRQNHLKTLKLEGLAANSEDPNLHLQSIFTESFMENYNFKLKGLTLICKLRYYERFSRFLMQQSDTLEEISLVDSAMDFHYFRLVINNCHRLRKIRLCIKTLLNDSRIEEIKNIEMPSVTELEIADHCKDIFIFKTIVEMFPNLEVLRTKICFFSLRGILEKLPKLEKLHLRDVNLECLVSSTSDSVKILKLIQPYPTLDGQVWEEIAKNFPNIEDLSIQNFSPRSPKQLKSEIKHILESFKFFKNLRSFEVTSKNSSELEYNDDNSVNDPERNLTNPDFKIFIKSKGVGGVKSMVVTNYFALEHAETIKSLNIRDVALIEH